VLVAAQRQQMLLHLKLLFGERDPYFLRADRVDVVIVLQHAVLPRDFRFSILIAPGVEVE
jgi:hypothetical protein